MATWDIHVPAAGAVIQKAAGQAAKYQSDLTAVEDDFSAAQTNLKNSPLVLARLGEFGSEVIKPDITAIAGHTDSALQGTTDAIRYYQAGDQQMAAEAQRNAAAASYPTSMPGAGHGAQPH